MNDSQGKCVFCNKLFNKTTIARHFVSELTKKEKITKTKGKSFLLKVTPRKRYGNDNFFLYLWIDGDDTMDYIDDFLRSIWLECCGHMSAFNIPEKNRKIVDQNLFEILKSFKEKDEGISYDNLLGEISGEIPFEMKTKEILRKGLELEYQYDFGYTTHLTIKVIDEFSIPASGILLSRNEPLEIYCDECGTAPAVKICTIDRTVFCKKCLKKYPDLDEYEVTDIVNSPRVGVCGYEGGSIDKKRDGIFKKEKEPSRNVKGND